jgi:hypothetical protein
MTGRFLESLLEKYKGAAVLLSNLPTKHSHKYLRLTTLLINLQQPTTTYNNLQQPTTTYNNLQQPTTTYNNLQQPTTTYNNLQTSTEPTNINMSDTTEVTLGRPLLDEKQNAPEKGESKTLSAETEYPPMSQGAHCADSRGVIWGFAVCVRRLSGTDMKIVAFSIVQIWEGTLD